MLYLGSLDLSKPRRPKISHFKVVNGGRRERERERERGKGKNFGRIFALSRLLMEATMEATVRDFYGLKSTK